MEEMTGMLTAQEITAARKALETALGLGAQKARVTVNKSLMELFGTLNGELDKVSHCLDRSMMVCLFVDGRFGSFSTNRLNEDELYSFLAGAVSMTRMLAPDECRDLPDPERTAKDAKYGDDLGLCDHEYSAMTADRRLNMALDAAIFKKHEGEGLVSEEGEYSDSILDTLILDSNGLECRHTETSFEYGVEVTWQDAGGNKFSGYWWDASPFLGSLKTEDCGETALKRAMAQSGHSKVECGKYMMVADNECSSRLVTPLLNALGGYSLQQKNSFMLDTLDRKVLPEWLDIIDKPRTVGETGSRLFDSEGVAATERPIIEKGVVKEYFINTYMSRKMGIEPTIEDVTRPAIPAGHAPSFPAPETYDKDGIMKMLGEGILVTGFNGGNSNSATGDFSFGIEGFYFKDGRIVHPVREMLMTGNLLTLWNNLVASGNDYRLCKSKLIPTLAFSNVEFSA